MYEVFYRFKAEPFRLSPDHNFCFKHKSYAKAKAYMQYAFQRAEGFVMVTGQPGTGKTTLVHDLAENLTNARVKIGMLVCTQLEADDLLRMVAYAFGINAEEVQKAIILQRLGKLLVSNYKEGRRVLLIIDEAQDLSVSALEELRLLTNLQLNSRPLLQIFLLGQEELKALVQHPRMEQVRQRLVATCHIEPLKEDETRAYIKHRLMQVGWRGDPAISDAVYPLIYKFSRGIPRKVNLICSRLLLHGCVEEKHTLGTEDARTVMAEIQNEQLMTGSMPTELDFAVADHFDSEDFSSSTDMDSQPADKRHTVSESGKAKAPPPTAKRAPPAQGPIRQRHESTNKLARENAQAPLARGNPAIQPIPTLDLSAEANTADYRPSRHGPGREPLQSTTTDAKASAPISEKPYTGPDSRRYVRRKVEDRRKEIRFEPGKEDRRKNSGRRKGDNSGSAWNKSKI